MKSLLRIFLFATGMFSVNQVEAQIITINTYGRVEKKPSDNLSNDKSEAEILPPDTNEQSVDTTTRSIPPLARRFYAPLKNMTPTSDYGWRKHPVTGGYKFHSGIDLKAWYEPVYAVADGIVKKAAWGNLEGNYIVLVHGNAETIYCHLSKLLCSPGDTLKGGSVLGISGNTGRSTGPHLHFGATYNDVRIDPIELFKSVGL